MEAIVREIQIGGGRIVDSLEAACREYIRMVDNSGEDGYRAKLCFILELPIGEVKQITIRDTDSQTVAYGDFGGLPSFLDYAKKEVE